MDPNFLSLSSNRHQKWLKKEKKESQNEETTTNNPDKISRRMDDDNNLDLKKNIVLLYDNWKPIATPYGNSKGSRKDESHGTPTVSTGTTEAAPNILVSLATTAASQEDYSMVTVTTTEKIPFIPSIQHFEEGIHENENTTVVN